MTGSADSLITSAPDIPALTRAALAGDAAAIRELRRLGVLAADGTGLFPVTEAQASLWLWHQHNQNSSLYVMFGLVPVPEGADQGTVTAVLTALIRRHEALRTTYTAREGVPMQRVHPAGPPALTTAERAAEAVRAIEEPFDLEAGPLARFVLLSIPGRPRRLLVVLHHLIADGTSMSVLAEELNRLLADPAAPLPPAPWSPKTFAVWQAKQLDGPRGAALAADWRQRLAGIEPAALPTDWPRPDQPDHRGASFTRNLSADTVAAVTRLTARVGCTPLAALAWATGVVLSREADAQTVVLGVPCQGRVHPNTERAVGLFANPLPLRLDFRADDTAAASLAGAAGSLAWTLERQDYPQERLIEAGLLPRRPGHHPLFDVVVTMQPGSPGFAAAGDELEELARSAVSGARFDLMLTLEPCGSGFRLMVEYATALLRPERVAALASRIEAVLAAAAADPDRPLRGLDRPTVAEILRFCPPATSAVVPDVGVATRFERIAAVRPQAVALTWGDPAAPEEISYGALDEQASAIAARLMRAEGVIPGDVVGLAGPLGPLSIAAMIGILKAGAAVMPLDPALPAARLERMNALGRPRLALAAGAAAEALAAVLPDLTLRDPATMIEASPLPTRDAGPAALASVLFTSGSTGEPKAVMVPAGGILRLVAQPLFDFDDRASLLQQAAPSFDAALLEIWGALLSGARLHLPAPGEVLTPGGLATLIRERAITHLFLTTSLLHRFAQDEPEIFRSLRMLITGGEVLNPALAARILAACPGLALINGYGPTENTTFTTLWKVSAEECDGPLPIGRPLSGDQVVIVDRLGEPAPIGASGEILCGGPGVALGYAGRPDLTARAFVELAALPGRRFYRTGDIGRWRDDGVLEFQGRRDGQIKIRGHRIEPGEIEAALTRLPEIAEAVVLAVSAAAGDALELVAVVRSERSDPAGWRRALAETLPAAMIPARFVVVDAILTNEHGKADRARLAQLAVARQGEGRTPAEAPVGPGEELAARLFCEALESAAVGRDDDFFDLGGHSLKAMRLLARLERETDRRLTLGAFMAAPTVRAVGAWIEADSSGGAGWAPIPRAPEAPDYPLTPAQVRLWTLARLAPDSAAYTIAGAVLLEGEIDAARLDAALAAVSERHEVLRARFVLKDDQPRQSFDAPPTRLVVEQAPAGEDPLSWARARAAAEECRPFDLAKGPPLRAHLLCLDANRAVLHLALPHIVADGWSVSVLMADLGRAWAGERLAPLSVRYRDYAMLAATGPDPADLDYWRRQLADPPPPLELPADRPRPPLVSTEAGTCDFRLDADTTRRLTGLSGTLFPALAASYGVLLARLSGQDDLVIGVPVAGRDHDQLGEQVGLFVNTLALRLRIDLAQPFSELVSAVARQWAEALDHRACPFEAVVEAVNPPRDPARSPLFDAMLVVQSLPPLDLSLPGLTVQRLDLPSPGAKFDLTLTLEERDGGLACRIEYAARLFDHDRIERLAEQFRTLVDAALADPASAAGDLCLLPEAERRAIDGFNATERPFDETATVVDRLAVHAAASPTAPAVIGPEDGVVDYGTLAERAAHLARAIAARGLGAGDVVGLCGERSAAQMIGLWAIWRAGCVYLPLDPALPAPRLAGMVEDAAPRLILAAPGQAELAARLGAPVLDILEAVPPPAAPEPAAPTPLDPVYVLFTSGSTGRPKGAVIRHRALVNRLDWMTRAFALGPRDVILHKTPISFDVSVWELAWWAQVGAAQALLPPEAEKDPGAIVRAIERHRATVIHFVPSMLIAFLDWLEGVEGVAAAARLASLRLIVASGEALGRDTALRCARLLPTAELHNLYGPTEATIDVTWQPATAAALAGDDGPIPIGRPIDNCRVHIVDRRGRRVPIGVWGEIWLGGVQVADGYLNRADLTAERFGDDPFVPGGRIYRTGDRGRWRPDGRIEYGGRLDQQVKIRGMRIEPGEIEAALAALPGVTRAVVGTKPGPGGETLLIAHVAGDPGLTGRELRARLRERLPEAMVPNRFYALDSVTLSPSGKLDRRALGRQPLAGDAAARAAVVQQAAKDAGGDTLNILAAMWSEVLQGSGFGPEDSFFDVGGTSLRLIALHERIARRWPGRLAVADLFRHHTLAAQARALSDAPSAAVAAAPAGRPAATAEIAVIGVGLRLADYRDLDSLWADLAGAVDRVGPLDTTRAADTRAMMTALGITEAPRFAEAAFLDDIAGFDYRRFRMSPADAALLDPEHRVFLETAAACLDDAGLGGEATRGARVGVFVGASSTGLFRAALSRAFPERAEQIFALNVPSSLATRLGYLLDWHGPAALVDSACSSSLNALHLAVRALRAGECDMALVGGVRLDPMPHRAPTRFAIDASTGRTHAFDASADGTGAGEGAVALLLKPLGRALADGDPIQAVIRGSAVNQDGASAGITAPNPEAQAAVIREAALDAGVSLASIGYVEAHGTGTKLGDPIEVRGLALAFQPDTPRVGFAGLGSVKGNFGHLDAAAGLLGLLKALLVLRENTLVPQPFFTTPNPAIDFDTAPVFVPRALTPLPAPRAGVSSFGLSGVNVHVIVDAAPAPEPLAEGWAMVPLSAASDAGLATLAAAMAQSIARHPDWTALAVAHTLTVGRAHLGRRGAVIARDRSELLAGLGALAAGNVPPLPADAPTALRAAAEVFLAGAMPSWPDGEARPRRLPLPFTPFEHVRCWPDFAAAGAVTEVASAGWLGEGVDAGDGWLHRLPLHEPRLWAAAEHRLGEQPVLVGMALPRLAAEATAFHRPTWAALRLADIVWHRSLAPNGLRPGSVLARLREAGGDDTLRLALEGRAEGAAVATLFAEATISAAPSAPPPIDPAAWAAECPRPHPRPRPSAQGGAIAVSPRWDCIEQVSSSDDETIWMARLALDPAFAADLAAPGPHPALLDIAASLGLPGGLLPAACESMALYPPFPGRLLARLAVRGAAGGPGRRVVDLTLADADGRVVARLDGLVLARAGAVPVSFPDWEARPALTLWPDAPAPLVWAESGLSERLATVSPAATIVDATADPAEVAARALAQPGRPIIVALPPMEPEAMRLARFLQALLAKGLAAPTRLLVIGHGAYTDDSASPDSALFAGLALAVRHEEPLLSPRYLDADPTTPAAAILAELDATEDDPVTVWRQGGRFGRRLASAPPAGLEPQRLPGSGAVVITGGLGGLGLVLARALAGRPGMRLALLSRRAAITGEGEEADARRALLAELQASATPPLCLACDVADRDSLAVALATVRERLGPITGVIHCAGIEGDGFLLHKDPARLQAVLAAKVGGARLLDSLTAADPVEMFLLAGSLTGLGGAAGQTDYTAANAFLDAFARWRRGRGRPALSIDWPAIRDLGMARRLGVAIPAGAGMESALAPAVVEAALASGAAQVVVAATESVSTSAATAVEPAADTPPTVALITPQDRPASAMEQAIAQIWGEELGYDTIDITEDYYALGGDSIVGMSIVNRLGTVLGRQVSLATLLGAGSVEALAASLEAQTPPPAAAAAEASATVLTPAPPADHYPLTAAQRAVWRAMAGDEGGITHTLPLFFEIEGNADPARLQQAFVALIRRHAILRSRVIEHAGEPWLVVEPDVPFVMAIDRIAPEDLETHARALIQPFDPARAPLLRAALVEVTDGRRFLFLATHHLVADAMTLELLVADLAALYDGVAEPAPALAQIDYAVWEQAHLEAGERARVLDYWAGRHPDGLAVVDLPADRPRPPRHTHEGGAVAVRAEAELLEALRAQARRLRVTPHALVLTALALLLSRLSGAASLCLGIADNGRVLPETERMTGMFSRLLPLPVTVAADDTVASLVARLHGESLAAQDHRLLETDRLVERLGQPPSPDRAGIADLALSYMNFAEGDYRATGLGLRPLGSGDKRSSAGDLTLFARETRDQLDLVFEYYAAIFDAVRIERIAARMLTLLRALAAASPDDALTSLPWLPAEERTQMAAFNPPASAPLPYGTLDRALAAVCAANASAPAVADTSRRLDYAGFDAASAGLAGALAAAGAGPGVIVGLIMERGVPAVVAMAATIRTGAAYLPLDPAEPPSRLALLLREAGCGLVVADDAGRAAVAAAGVTVRLVDPEARATPPTDVRRTPESPACVMYTSGSTGVPKGVVVPDRAILRLAHPQALHRIVPEDHVAQVAPLAFDASTLEIWGAVLAGARLTVVPLPAILEPGGLGRVIAEHGLTWMWLTASLCQRLAEADAAAFRPLRALLSGGEALSPPHMARILAACPGLLLINGYGPTENTTFTTTWAVTAEDCRGPIPIGRPIPGGSVHILDSRGEPAPIGVWGEIHCAGSGLALGYLNRPDATAAAFVTVAALPDTLLYRTGDIGRWREDGVIEFLGRRDSQIKLRGHRIEPEEVERALTAQPGVVAALIGVEGSGETARLAAGLVTAPGFDLAACLAALRRMLPPVMIPARFVALTEIPLTPTGKADRSRMAALLADAPELRPAIARDAPADEAERHVARAFATLFGRDDISRHEDFYDLGGHSLLAARLAAMLAAETGVEIGVGEILRLGTVAAIAARLAELPRVHNVIAPVPPAADYPASAAQQRLFVLAGMKGADTAYTMPFVFAFPAPFDIERFADALAAIAERHEALRTGFVTRDGEVRQVISPAVSLPVERIDLTADPDPHGEAFRRIRRALSTPFDLSRPPLARVLACDIGHEVIVALLMHHIIGDGWSMRILFRDLVRLDAARRGLAPLPPPLAIQYKDYAVWEQGQEEGSHAAYWRTQLAGASDRVALPADRPIPASRSFRGAAIRQRLDAGMAAALHRAARRRDATLASLMMALFASLLFRLTRQDDLVLGLGVAGRARPEIAEVVGFFVNILPIRIRLDEDMAFDALVSQVQGTMLEAMDRQEFPFDQLVRAVAPRRVANRQPLLNIAFEYQDFALPGDNPPTGGLVSRPIDDEEMRSVESGSAKFDITLFVVAEPDETIQLRLEYDTDLFEETTVRAWLGHLITFAGAVAGQEAAT